MRGIQYAVAFSDQSPAPAFTGSPAFAGDDTFRVLQRLQIFDQVVALVLVQLAANDAGGRRALQRVAENAIAVDRRTVGVRRREQGFALAANRRFAGDRAIADLLRIEIAGADAELCGTLGRGREHPVERGNRTIVKVGSGRPDAVQRARAIMLYLCIVWIGAVLL